MTLTPSIEMIGVALVTAGLTGLFVGLFVGYVVGRYTRPKDRRLTQLREDIEYVTESLGP